jgi:hypothetical protein
MDRSEVEALLACAQDRDKWIRDTPQTREALAALCRTWLAVAEAPEAGMTVEPGHRFVLRDADPSILALDGQRVALVRVPVGVE